MLSRTRISGIAVALAWGMATAGAGAAMPAPSRRVVPVALVQPAAFPAGTTVVPPAADETPPAPVPDRNPPVLACAGPGWG